MSNIPKAPVSMAAPEDCINVVEWTLSGGYDGDKPVSKSVPPYAY